MAEEKETVQQAETSEETTEDTTDQYPLGPTGPSAKRIQEWKDQGYKLQYVWIADTLYVYRQVGKSEHQAWLNEGKLEPDTLDRDLVRLLVLWPEDAENINWEEEFPAGVVPTLAQNIMMFSGFGAQSQPMQL